MSHPLRALRAASIRCGFDLLHCFCPCTLSLLHGNASGNPRAQPADLLKGLVAHPVALSVSLEKRLVARTDEMRASGVEPVFLRDLSPIARLTKAEFQVRLRRFLCDEHACSRVFVCTCLGLSFWMLGDRSTDDRRCVACRRKKKVA